MCVRVHCEFPNFLLSKGRKTLCANEELSRDVSYQNSCKKVRFAEKQRLEIFDTTKAPVTPLQSCLPSSSLRSALKKTPVKTVKILPEGMTVGI